MQEPAVATVSQDDSALAEVEDEFNHALGVATNECRVAGSRASLVMSKSVRKVEEWSSVEFSKINVEKKSEISSSISKCDLEEKKIQREYERATRALQRNRQSGRDAIEEKFEGRFSVLRQQKADKLKPVEKKYEADLEKAAEDERRAIYRAELAKKESLEEPTD